MQRKGSNICTERLALGMARSPLGHRSLVNALNILSLMARDSKSSMGHAFIQMENKQKVAAIPNSSALQEKLNSIKVKFMIL